MTGLLRQYAEQKVECGDAVLLFRMGDFYEAFYEDAKVLSRVMGTPITHHAGKRKGILAAGIPFHALHDCLAKLITAGYRVAVSEQVEDPRLVKGVIQRKTVRIVIPETACREQEADR